MSKIKLISGDDVIIIAGKDKGKVGKIIKIIRTINKKKQHRTKVLVSGIAIYSKSIKPRGEKQGGITNIELPIDISNVSMLDPKFKIPTKIGYKFIDGKKVRFAKVSCEVIG